MQSFSFYMPVDIRFGRGAVQASAQVFSQFGKRAFIVTGRHSARACGALQDVTDALISQGAEWTLCDLAENNPSLENIEHMAGIARTFRPDMVIGIGGGSPLDAAKAVAVLAVNHLPALRLYENQFPVQPLPVIAIPTTAGTGSEVTPYAILTRHDLQTKMSFGTRACFPVAALVDPGYTDGLPAGITRDTATDAMTHCLEGFIGKKSSGVTDKIALEGLQMFASVLPALRSGEIAGGDRDRLMMMSVLGGMVIAHTGTTSIHGMGYSMTYFRGIPHGRANGLFVPSYLEYLKDKLPGKVSGILSALHMKEITELRDALMQINGGFPALSDEEISEYAKMASKQRSIGNNPVFMDQKVLEEIIRGSRY